MDQSRLLPPPGADKKPFLDTDLPVHRVNDVEAFLARDVCRVLGLSTTHGARGCPADQRVSIRLETLDGGPQDHVGVTIPGAFVMATHCRSELTASLRAHVDKVIVRGMTEAAKPPAAALESKLDDALAQIATLTALVRAIPVLDPRAAARLLVEADVAREDVRRERKARHRVVPPALLEAVRVWLETQPLDAEIDPHRAATACGVARDRAGILLVAEALVQLGMVRGPRRRDTGLQRTWVRPYTVTEADVVRALRAELGTVSADALAKRYRWKRQAVRDMLLGLEKAGRVDYVSRGPKGQGWRVRPEVV